MTRQPLCPRTLRWASASIRKSATNSRGLQMLASLQSAPFLRNKANALDEVADRLLHEAQAIESRAKGCLQWLDKGAPDYLDRRPEDADNDPDQMLNDGDPGEP